MSKTINPLASVNTQTAPVALSTQPSTGSTASKTSPVITLVDCNDWLQLTYADELAELAKLGAHVQARAVCAPHEEISPSTAVLVIVKDGLVGGATGPEGELTFTFWENSYPKVELGALTMPPFQAMAHRFWQALPDIKAVYQARADYIAAHIAATDDSPAHAMPDVEDQAAQDGQEDAIQCHWFTGATMPKMDETQHHYPLSKLVALVNTYDQWAETYERSRDAYDDWIDAQAPEIG